MSMDLFVEKNFFEEFELEYYCSDHKTESQLILFQLFNQYNYIRLYTDASEKLLEESELLSRLTDNNASVRFEVDIDRYFQNFSGKIFQTLIFTKEPRNWFSELRSKGALCFSLCDYECGIKDFINATHLKIDLSDPENLPFKWNKFRFIYEHSNVLIISDPYILADKSQQEIRNNLIPLLKENLNKDHHYLAFIFTDVGDDKSLADKLQKIHSALADYNVKLFVFNRLKQITHLDFHDRIIYSNYTISESGIGFNLTHFKRANSQLISSSIFEKYTYKRFCIHFSELATYISKLEKFNHLNNPFKTNSAKAYAEFSELWRFFLNESSRNHECPQNV